MSIEYTCNTYSLNALVHVICSVVPRQYSYIVYIKKYYSSNNQCYILAVKEMCQVGVTVLYNMNHWSGMFTLGKKWWKFYLCLRGSDPAVLHWTMIIKPCNVVSCRTWTLWGGQTRFRVYSYFRLFLNIDNDRIWVMHFDRKIMSF